MLFKIRPGSGNKSRVRLQKSSDSSLVSADCSGTYTIKIVSEESISCESMDAKAFHTVFSLSEIVEMENILKKVEEVTLDQEFCEKLAATFSSSANRAGKAPLTWKQVHSWFEDNKQKELLADDTSSPTALNLCVDLSDAAISGRARESYNNHRGNQDIDLSELAFEAKSFKDGAWYDITSFLSYRVMSTGELEARVRFSGFGKEHDEWVNVKKELQERSIPLEPSECHRICTGDLVLSFRDGLYQAIYYDARVAEIERNPHGPEECTCVFVVLYDIDSFEEKVGLGRLCCRPSQEGKWLLQLTDGREECGLNISLDNLWG